MKGERGFTLVEMLLGLAITGMVAAVLGISVQQVITVPAQGDAHVDALHAVQNAAHWLNLDGQAAKEASVNGSELYITLPDDTIVVYDLSGSYLNRTCDNASMTVARDIAGVSFIVEDRTITMNITASPESRWDFSENQTYQVYMRPTEQE